MASAEHNFGDLFDFWKIPRRAVGTISSGSKRGIVVNDCAKSALSNSIVKLELGDELRPEWIKKGELVPLAIETVPEPYQHGEPLAYFHAGDKKIPAVVRDGSRIVFNFNPANAADYLLNERYCVKGRPLYTMLPFHYHRIPFRLQISRLLSAYYRSEVGSTQFPSWPVEKSVDALRHLFRRCAEIAYGSNADGDFWKGKRYALCLSHDVDTAKGLANIELFKGIEDSAGVSATYNLVTNYYRLDAAVVSGLSKSHEIGWHGYNHDGKLAFLPEEKIRARFSANKEFFKRFSVHGMRSPCMLTSDALYRVAGEFVGYDSSVPDTAMFIFGSSAISGCCSVFPFARGRLVELPLTLPMDADLLYLGFKPNQILDAWLSKLEWIKTVGGLAILNTHTDPHYSGSDEMLGIYERFIRRASRDNDALRETCCGIASHWRASGRSGRRFE